jgi:2-isopropylmalate synthase
VLSAHCHDDLGLAVANSLAAIQAGARQVECTINGIGERAGNAALEEIASALYVRGDYFGLTTSIKLDKLYPTSEVLGQLITFRPSPNKAIVGANAFAHESGIHQHGMLANPLCYEIMTPQLVGVAKTLLILGKHSGRAALRHRLEQLGFTTISREELQNVYYRFVALADRKKNIYDQDLVGLLPDSIRERRSEPVSELD